MLYSPEIIESLGLVKIPEFLVPNHMMSSLSWNILSISLSANDSQLSLFILKMIRFEYLKLLGHYWIQSKGTPGYLNEVSLFHLLKKSYLHQIRNA